MKRRTLLYVGLAGLGLLAAASVAAIGGFAVFVDLIIPDDLPVATAYEPTCSSGDDACTAWASFRTKRPIPYQAVAILPVDEHRAVVLLTEPDSRYGKAEIDRVVAAAFGSDLLAAERLRWRTHYDGWLEDLVLTVQLPQGEVLDRHLEAAPLTRERLELLNELLFDTAYGADPGAYVEDSGMERVPGLDLTVSAADLQQWTGDLQWTDLAAPLAQSLPWTQVMAPGRSGAFWAQDGSLVAFVLPLDKLAAARRDPRVLDDYRASWRRFAVAGDVVLGGTWTKDGQLAILCRARQVPQDLLPPMRFETFAILAAETSTQLSQSYERTRPLAGKFPDGAFELRDWAPIHLSASLVDTELGALLNITDQMLKSWSEHGNVEYLFFDYPLAPTHWEHPSWPFDDSLSDLVSEKHGSSSVLFNWNTSGVGARVDLGEKAWLTTGHTGALPVTYGSDLGGLDTETGHLLPFEDQAYAWYTQTEDPNLAKVVHYTLLYQVFQAALADRPIPTDAWEPPSRRHGTEVLAQSILTVLRELRKRDQLPAEVQSALALGLDDERLAAMMADPRGAEEALAKKGDALVAKQRALLGDAERLDARNSRLNEKIEAYNRGADRYNRDQGPTSLRLELERMTKEIEEEQRAIQGASGQLGAGLQAEVDALEQESKNLQIVQTAGLALAGRARDLAAENSPVVDMEAVFTAFVERNAEEPLGAIRTASVILSWASTGTFASVGGHNLDSKAVRFVLDEGTTDLTLVDGPSGKELHFPSTMAEEVSENAPKLARAMEHKGEGEVTNLRALLHESPGPTRSRADALGLERKVDPAAGGDGAVPPRPPTKHVAQAPDPEPGRRLTPADLGRLAEQSDCCVYVSNAETGGYVMALPNGAPPPATLIRYFADPATLRAGIRNIAGSRQPFLVGMSEPQVEGLTLQLQKPGLEGLVARAEQLGGGAGGKPPPRSGQSAGAWGPEEPFSVRFFSQKAEALGSKVQAELLALLGRRPAWRNARVKQVEPARAQALLQHLDWVEARDGTPYIVELDLTGDALPDVHVAAGLRAAQGAAKVDATLQQSLQQGEAGGWTLEETVKYVRAQLRASGAVDRVNVLIGDENGRIELSRVDLPRLGEDPVAHG